MIELRFYRDGGQTAVEVASQVAAFFGGAQTSLELALYDIRLHDDAAEIVTGALLAARDRGVAVRLVYNVDHPGPIPVPPPPQTAPELLEALRTQGELTDTTEKTLTAFLDDFARTFA